MYFGGAAVVRAARAIRIIAKLNCILGDFDKTERTMSECLSVYLRMMIYSPN
jgi:hypothetical protein